jgi:hypothetical protein
MTHLTDIEHVDFLDGMLAPERARHLDGCASCREESERVRDALARAVDATMPEPSPLFWEHFSARVQEGVRAADTPAPAGWRAWAGSATVRWAFSGALLTLLLVGGLWKASAPPGGAPVPVEAPSAAVSPNDAFDVLDHLDADGEEAWALVRIVADDVLVEDASWDDAATEGLGVRPGSAERAIGTLTGAERTELARLLEAETKQPGA